jgi:hypothetical protein
MKLALRNTMLLGEDVDLTILQIHGALFIFELTETIHGIGYRLKLTAIKFGGGLAQGFGFSGQ